MTGALVSSPFGTVVNVQYGGCCSRKPLIQKMIKPDYIPAYRYGMSAYGANITTKNKCQMHLPIAGDLGVNGVLFTGAQAIINPDPHVSNPYTATVDIATDYINDMLEVKFTRKYNGGSLGYTTINYPRNETPSYDQAGIAVVESLLPVSTPHEELIAPSWYSDGTLVHFSPIFGDPPLLTMYNDYEYYYEMDELTDPSTIFYAGKYAHVFGLIKTHRVSHAIVHYIELAGATESFTYFMDTLDPVVSHQRPFMADDGLTWQTKDYSCVKVAYKNSTNTDIFKVSIHIHDYTVTGTDAKRFDMSTGVVVDVSSGPIVCKANANQAYITSSSYDKATSAFRSGAISYDAATKLLATTGYLEHLYLYLGLQIIGDNSFLNQLWEFNNDTLSWTNLGTVNHGMADPYNHDIFGQGNCLLTVTENSGNTSRKAVVVSTPT